MTPPTCRARRSWWTAGASNSGSAQAREQYLADGVGVALDHQPPSAEPAGGHGRGPGPGEQVHHEVAGPGRQLDDPPQQRLRFGGAETADVRGTQLGPRGVGGADLPGEPHGPELLDAARLVAIALVDVDPRAGPPAHGAAHQLVDPVAGAGAGPPPYGGGEIPEHRMDLD